MRKEQCHWVSVAYQTDRQDSKMDSEQQEANQNQRRIKLKELSQPSPASW